MIHFVAGIAVGVLAMALYMEVLLNAFKGDTDA